MSGDRTYRERIDPDGEVGRQMEGLAALVQSPLRHLLRARGLDDETLNEALALRGKYKHLTTEPDRIATALAPLGWVFSSDSPLDDYSAAATLVEEGKSEEAEALLTEKWNENEWSLLRPVLRVKTLYRGDDDRDELGEHRQRLLRTALDLHRDGNYAGSIPIVLAQIDGIFIDATGKTVRDYFFKPTNPSLVDDETIAGHPLGLRAISEVMSQQVTETAATGGLLRHGIIHGRELSYDTLRNSTKAFAALGAVIEVVQPHADALSRQASDARELRYAGSKEFDSDGRRLDRRGFDETKQFLLQFSNFQLGYHRRHGCYAREHASLDPAGLLLGGHDGTWRVSEDGQQYWVGETTPTGFVFGVAGCDGEYPVWQYQGERPPSGGPESGEDWRHVARDPAPSEW